MTMTARGRCWLDSLLQHINFNLTNFTFGHSRGESKRTENGIGSAQVDDGRASTSADRD